MEDYWFKQTIDEPLYTDLIWSRPENKTHAGKLLIVGGSTNGFAHTVGCYTESLNAGAGIVKVLIPESTKKLIGNWSEDIIYGAATKSGGFGGAALAELFDSSDWSNCVLMSGELGNNSETTVLFEKFLEKYDGPLVIAGDAFEFVQNFYDQLLNNNKVVFVLDIVMLQKFVSHSGISKPIVSGISLINLIEILHELTEKYKSNLVINFSDFIVVASQGYISTTKLKDQKNISIKLAANCAVWYMQNKTKIFEALSCSAITSQTIINN